MGINAFYKTIKVVIVVIALTFSTTTHAATPIPLTWGIFNWFSWGDDNHQWGDDDHHWGDDDHHKGDDDDHSGGGNTSVPLDGGLSILLIGAAAFGVKKLRGNKNEDI